MADNARDAMFGRIRRALGVSGDEADRREAVAALKETEGVFDIIFCDIVKEQYPEALPVITEKLRPGGVLIADNAWWCGRVIHEADQSAPTEGMRVFTQELVNDPSWIVTFLPLRDGLLVAYRAGGEKEAVAPVLADE